MTERFKSSYASGSYPQTGNVGVTPANDEPVIDLKQIFNAIWRAKFLVAFIASLFVFAGGYYAFFVAKPMFRSTAVVMLNSREEEVLGLEGVLGGLTNDVSIVNTEVEILRSRSLMAKVVEDLDLTADPEFNGALTPPTGIAALRQQIVDMINPPTAGATRSPEERAARQFEATIDALIGHTSVRNIPQSLVFQVTVRSENGPKAAMIADRLVELYILNQLEVKFEATQQATEWLSGRVAELQIQLESAEAALKDFRASSEIVSGETLQALERQLKDVRDRIDALRIVQSDAEALLAAMDAAQTPEEKLAASGEDSQLAQLLPRIDTASIADAFERRFEQVRQRAEFDLVRAQSQLTALETSRDELDAQISGQSDELITLQQLTREAEANRLLYEYFLARLKETSAQQGVQQADSRLLSSAVVPTGPFEPRKSRIVALSGFVGVMAGVALALLLEARTDTFRTGAQLEKLTGYRLLGQLPKFPGRRRRDVVDYLEKKPTSVAAEAVRNLRTSIMLSNSEDPPQVIMTSSSLPAEGKTTVTLTLAHNIARMGKKVLLVEGDIRRRVMQAYFNDPIEGKLLAVVNGEVPLAEGVSKDAATGADILLAEKSSENAADFFSSVAFADFITEARKTYDLILIDTPPVLVVTDARIIAQHTDAIMFVVRWDVTQKEQVFDALKSFESVKQPVSGLVLNQVDHRRMRRYGYGAYGAYGRKYYNN